MSGGVVAVWMHGSVSAQEKRSGGVWRVGEGSRDCGLAGEEC